jgi:hypothetical protein
MASARRAARLFLLAVVVLACAQRASAAWGKKAEPAKAEAKPAADAKASASHQDDTGVNTYWRVARQPLWRATRRARAALTNPRPHAACRAPPGRRYNEVTGEVSSRDPSIDYRGFDSASGHKYWIDPATGESSWERPAAYAWKEEPSAEHAGHSYYYNTVRIRAGCCVGRPARLAHAAVARPDGAAVSWRTCARPGAAADASRGGGGAGDQGEHVGPPRYPGLEGAWLRSSTPPAVC